MKTSRDSAFTLVETLLAMVLLSGALMVLGNAWSGAMNSVRKSRSLTTVSLLLQRKIAEFEVKYRDKLNEMPEKEEGNFGEELADYTWKMETKKLTMPDLTATLSSQAGGISEQQMMIIKLFAETVENVVREMKLAVFWKVADKVMEYSVTTYIVDYDKATLGGLGGSGTPASGGSGSTGGGGSAGGGGGGP